MPTGFTVPGVVNEALSLISAQTTITALNEGTPAAIAASAVYSPTVYLLLRELDPDFARYTATLAAAGGAAVTPWTSKYVYPSDCIRLRQVRPAAGTPDPFDPVPIRFNVGFDLISAVSTKVILTNQASALAVYSTSAVDPAQWDATFCDAVVRRLGSYLAMSLSGRPDFAKELLDEGNRVAMLAEAVDDSMVKTS